MISLGSFDSHEIYKVNAKKLKKKKGKNINVCFFSLQSLLSDPNPNSPANSMAAQLYKENRREYEKRVKACVEQSFVD